nr:hypothetical protein [Tanacetum cinerariifolium]
MIRETTKKIVQKNRLLTARSRQKSYADRRVGPIAYALELPEELKWIHSTFHVSNLKKCLEKGDIVVLMDEIQLDDKLHIIKEGPEFTWERDDQIKNKYLHLFTSNDEARKSRQVKLSTRTALPKGGENDSSAEIIESVFDY